MNHLFERLEVFNDLEHIHWNHIHHDVKHGILRVSLLRLITEEGMLNFNYILVVHLFVNLQLPGFIFLILFEFLDSNNFLGFCYCAHVDDRECTVGYLYLVAEVIRLRNILRARHRIINKGASMMIRLDGIFFIFTFLLLLIFLPLFFSFLLLLLLSLFPIFELLFSFRSWVMFFAECLLLGKNCLVYFLLSFECMLRITGGG